MAAKSSKIQLEFVLGEHECSASKGILVIECIKYLLYERHQVPTTVDQILRYTEPEMEDSQKNSRPKPRLDSKKRLQFFNDLKCLFTNVEELFSSTTVYSTLIIFGSSAVSPKETYEINFLSRVNAINGPSLENKDRSCKRMSRKLLRMLVMNEELRNFKEIPSTPLLVFVQVPRSVENKWFRPKHSFKVPWRGNLCEISVKDERASTDTNIEEDLIWLQAPITIKGYCEKVKDDTSVYSEFWE